MPKVKAKSNGNGEVSRVRLLDSAEELFSADGFGATSIKDITNKAKCNIAAVNYHFSSKDNLYREVFHRRIKTMRDRPIKSIRNILAEKGESITLEELLHAFAHSFLEPLKKKSDHGKYMRLILRERLNPRLPHDLFFRQVIKPVSTEFQKALLKVVPDLSEEKALLCFRSFISQIIDVIRQAHMLREEHKGDNKLSPEKISRIIDHIVKFSVAGIEAVKQN